MSGELLRRETESLERFPSLRRRTSRELAEIRADGIVERARIERDEDTAAFKVDRRIDNAYQLGERVLYRHAAFSRMVTETSHNDPGLEMEGRRIAEVLAMGAESALHEYLHRR